MNDTLTKISIRLDRSGETRDGNVHLFMAAVFFQLLNYGSSPIYSSILVKIAASLTNQIFDQAR